MERPALESLWQATAPTPPRRASLGCDLDVDVAIIGAGYTGLWTAFYLKEADPALSIAVLEAHEVGFGASGRNGGWCSPRMSGLDTMLADPRARDAAAALQLEMYETVEEIGRVVRSESIDCDWAHGGAIIVATQPIQIGRLQAAAQRRVDAGMDPSHYRWLSRAETAQRVRMASSYGSLFTPHCAAVHPLKLVRGLAAAIERRGVVIYEGTPVTRIDPGRVTARGGTVRAATVVRATEAWSAELPGSRREVVPIYSLVVATPPLEDAVWEEIGLANRETFADGRHMVIYGQRTADGRIAFGGRGAPYHYGSSIDPGHDGDASVFSGLAETIETLFPMLRPLEIAFRWGGPLAISRDWTPTITFDRDARMGWAGAYGGQGVTTANLAGRVMTDLVLGNASALTELPIVGHRSRSWEPEPLRWLGINAGLTLAESVDRAEAAGKSPALRARVLKRLIGM